MLQCYQGIQRSAVDNRKEKTGIDNREVEIRITQGSSSGFASLKLYGTNGKKEYTVTVGKDSRSDIKYVGLLAEDIIKLPPKRRKFQGSIDKKY